MGGSKNVAKICWLNTILARRSVDSSSVSRRNEMCCPNSLLQICRLFVLASFYRALSAQTPTSAPSIETCMTGPSLEESNSIFVNGRQYLSDSEEVVCDGAITSWRFCHYVIGFRDLEMELWPGVWRRNGDIFSLVGLNIITIEPPGYEGNQLRCLEHDVDPLEWIEVKVGDYIGFFTPENGVFVASAGADPGRRQYQRVDYGYEETLNLTELELATTNFGRAHLRAVIDPNVERPASPSIDPLPSSSSSTSSSSPPTPSTFPQTPPVVCGPAELANKGNNGLIMEAVVPVVALVVILALLVVIMVLVILLRRRRRTNVPPIDLPLPRAVDATNPATGTSDNSSALYDAIYSQAYLEARDMASNKATPGKAEAAYSMRINPAYVNGSTIRENANTDTLRPLSPPVNNPAYATALPPLSTRQNSTSSLIRYPVMEFHSTRHSAHPLSPPPPTAPAPAAPAPPLPPLPYAMPSSSRPPPLTLKNPHASTSSSGSLLSPPPPLPSLPSPPSPPSPYANPYMTPRPVTPGSGGYYETVPVQTKRSSTMTQGSDQTSGADTQSTNIGSDASAKETKGRSLEEIENYYKTHIL